MEESIIVNGISIIIKRSPRIPRIAGYCNSKGQIVILCDKKTTNQRIIKYAFEHWMDKFIEDGNDDSSRSNVPNESDLVSDSSDSTEHRKFAGKYEYRFDYEGYEVYWYIMPKWISKIDIKIVGDSKILVDISRDYADDEVLRKYLEPRLDRILEQHLKKKYRVAESSNTHINTHSFSYCNPRTDITDTEFTKQSKHKHKGTVIGSTKTEPYIGERRRIKKKERIIGPDGRFRERGSVGDYGLRDKD